MSYSPRFVVLNDDKITDYISKKEELANKVKKISKQIESLEEDRNKLVLKIQRYNDKATPLIAKYQDENTLGEFEKYSRVYKDEKTEEIRLEIYDEIEEFKLFIKKRDEEEAKKKKDGDESANTNKENS